ncbi:MAG TPA: hypothetical protein PLD15_08455 [Mesotoga sp.]|nr:hypothetical protein [Mesotoga sp.]
MLEIERKFLYSGSMNDSTFEKAEVCLLIIQWYLSPPDTRRLRLAVSPESSRMIETVKTGFGMVREESEREISVEILHEMAYRLKCEKAVVKARYVYPRKSFEGVIDRYFVPDIGFVVEIETSQIQNVIPDPWVFWDLPAGYFMEVTENPIYTARSLAVKISDTTGLLPSSIPLVEPFQRQEFERSLSIVYG